MTFEILTLSLSTFFAWAGTAGGSNGLFAGIICAAILGGHPRLILVLTLAVHVAILVAPA